MMLLTPLINFSSASPSYSSKELFFCIIWHSFGLEDLFKQLLRPLREIWIALDDAQELTLRLETPDPYRQRLDNRLIELNL